MTPQRAMSTAVGAGLGVSRVDASGVEGSGCGVAELLVAGDERDELAASDAVEQAPSSRVDPIARYVTICICRV